MSDSRRKNLAGGDCKRHSACRWARWRVWSAMLMVVALSNLVVVPAAELSGPQVTRPTAFVPPWPTGPFVVLPGGGVLAGRLRSLSAEVLELDSVSFGSLQITPAAVIGYRQTAAIGPPRPVQPQSVQQAGNVTVILANGDRLDATGLMIEKGQCQVRLEPAFNEASLVTLPLERVAAIDWQDRPAGQQAALRLPATGQDVCWVALEDGSRFPVHAADVKKAPDSDNGRTRLRPVLPGLPVTLECATEEIAVWLPRSTDRWLAFEQAQVLPLVVAAAYPQVGGLLPVPREHGFRTGATCSGDWPRLRGQTGFSAVAIHAPGCVEYAIDPAAERFTAVVGLDDSVGQGGSVVVRVTAASAGQSLSAVPEAGQDAVDAQELFCSELIRGGEPPLQLDLPLHRVTRLRLHVEPATAGNVLDRTLWLDPRVHGPSTR
jgi:hypothetical protein